MPFDSFSNAGIAAIQAGIVDINGFPMGIAGVLANGSGAPLSIMKFSKRLGGAAPQPVRATAIGDNNIRRHEYLFNAANMGEVSLLFGAFDFNAYAGFTKLKKFTSGNGNAVLLQANAPVNAAQACVVVNMDAQDADSGAFGLKRYANEVYPLVTVAPLLANLQEVQAAEWGYYGIPTQAGQAPWGEVFTVTTHGASAAGGILIGSDYPLVVETLITTTSQTTYALTYTPATPTTQYFQAWTNNALLTTANATVAAKVVTLTGATNGKIYIFKYEVTDLLSNL